MLCGVGKKAVVKWLDLLRIIRVGNTSQKVTFELEIER